MYQEKWRTITLSCIFMIISVLLLRTQVSSQYNNTIPPTLSTPLPTSRPHTLLQAQLDRLDTAATHTSFAPLAPSDAVSYTRVITALADALITQGYPTANCGDELTMRVGYDTYLDPDGENLRSLIRFNLASLSNQATIHSATMWLYLGGSYDYSGHSVAITPYRVSSPWAEDTVTWNNQPSYAEAYTPAWVVHGNWGWYAFDVTDLVRHWVVGTYPNYGLILLNPDAVDEWRMFASSETVSPPHLIISYESLPSFTLTMVPDDQTVVSGQSMSSSSILYLTSIDGFSESTTLDIAGLPPNTTYAWSVSTVTPTASARLSITTTPDTPRGMYTLVITGTSASSVQTTTATLRVLQPDFEMGLQPASQSVWSGQDISYTAHLTATDGFTAGVALDIGGLPANTTAEWAANLVTPTVSTPLTITTSPDVPSGTYTFTITGTANSLVHTAQAVLHVLEPDFELNITPSWAVVGFEERARFTTHITNMGGVTESVTLDVGGLPPDTFHAWSTNPVTPATTIWGSVTTTWLTITTTPETPSGTYTFTITGTAGSLVHVAQAALHVCEPDFELYLDPSLRSVAIGGSTYYTAQLVAISNFTNSVTLDIAGIPHNTSSMWGANPIAPTASTVLTILTTSKTPTGTHTLTVTGTSGEIVHNASVYLTVLPDSNLETIYLPLVLRGYPSHGSTIPPAAQNTPVSRIALVIGVADYEHMEPITNTRQEDKTHDLGFPSDDAFDLEGELSRYCDCGQVQAPLVASLCGDTTLTMLVDSQATKGAIHAAIVNWMDPLEDENTLVMISFSGHGMYAPDDDGDENDPYDEFIVPHDIDMNEAGQWLTQTAISDDEFAGWLGELESQQVVVFIDSCFAGGMMITDTSSIKSFSWEPAAQTGIAAAQWRDSFLQDIQGTGRIVLAATTEEQGSWEFGELQNGVFTYYLVEALRSASADTNSNGWISAEEAYSYLNNYVDDYVWNHTSPPQHQNPQIRDGVNGEVDITQPVYCDSCPVW